jgi:hypothetical protein
MHKEGDTFWYHICKYTDKKSYLPIGMNCPDCVLNEMNSLDRAKLEQAEYLNNIEGND